MKRGYSTMTKKTDHKIAVIGLGYVGLPIAVALAEKYEHVVGFDVNQIRVTELEKGTDITLEVEDDRLSKAGLDVTYDIENPLFKEANIYIVCVPTPINANKEPDLSPLLKACGTLSKVLKKNDIIVFESTVYPGVTEEVCGPALEAKTGLKQSVDFKLGYSPERINPGDKINRLENINKVVAGEDKETYDVLHDPYKTIITEADIHMAPNIKVAEMSKAIENTQRDVNIALINEVAMICEKINIRTEDVLAAARTKWNFLPFTPGLVGGHCIGVDPYYLTSKSARLGHHADVIRAARRINDDMAKFVAQKTIKMLVRQNKPICQARIGILGLAFKENVGDIRNSKIPDIIKELKEYGANPVINDPFADPEEARHEFGVELIGLDHFKDMDALIYAVPHAVYLEKIDAPSALKKDGVFVDIKSKFLDYSFGDEQLYWCL